MFNKKNIHNIHLNESGEVVVDKSSSLKMSKHPIFNKLKPYFFNGYIDELLLNEEDFLEQSSNHNNVNSVVTLPVFNNSKWTKFNHVNLDIKKEYEIDLITFHIDSNMLLDCTINEIGVVEYFNKGLGNTFKSFHEIPAKNLAFCFSDLYNILFEPQISITGQTVLLGHNDINDIGLSVAFFYMNENNGRTSNRRISYDWNNIKFIKTAINNLSTNYSIQDNEMFEKTFIEKFMPKKNNVNK